MSIKQFRIWLKSLGLMRRRVQWSSTMTCPKFRCILQVAMGWDSIHLHRFVVNTVRYGSWEAAAESPSVALVDLKLCEAGLFSCEYKLDLPSGAWNPVGTAPLTQTADEIFLLRPR